MTETVNFTLELFQKLTQYLQHKQYLEALNIISEGKYDECITDDSLTVAPFLFKYINDKNLLENEACVQCCEAIILEIAQRTKPSAFILAFMEAIEDSSQNDCLFMVSTKTLLILMDRDQSKTFKIYECTLDCLQSYVKRVYHECSTKDPHRLFKNINVLFKFYETLILGIKNGSYFKNNQVDIVLASNLINLLYFTMALSEVAGVFQLNKQIIDTVILIVEPFQLLLHVSNRFFASERQVDENMRVKTHWDNYMNEKIIRYEDENYIRNISYGRLFLLMLDNEEEFETHFLYIYDLKFTHVTFLSLVASFFQVNHNESLISGLKLLNIAQKKYFCTLTKMELSLSFNKDIIVHLMLAMLFNEDKQMRQLAFICFKKFLLSFDWEGRYLLLFNMRSYVNHYGILGFLITMIKDFIRQFSVMNDYFYTKYFTGKILYELLMEYILLDSGETTNVVTCSDQITSTLNLLIFIIISDKNDEMSFKGYVNDINEKLIKILEICSETTRKTCKENLSILKKGDTIPSPFVVTVKDELVPEKSIDDQITVMNSMLCNIDLIDYLLSRLKELVTEVYQIRLE